MTGNRISTTGRRRHGTRLAAGLSRHAVAAAQCALLAVIVAAPARAQVAGPAPGAEQPIYCTGLDVRENYADLQWLRKVTYGRDGTMFRTEVDLGPVKPLGMIEYQYLRRLVEALRHRGTTLVMAVVPPRGAVLSESLDPSRPEHAAYDAAAAAETYRANLEIFRSAGALAPDLMAVARETMAAGDAFFYPDDLHWTSEGARAAAVSIAELIRSHEDYGRLTEHRFEIVDLGAHEILGRYAEVLIDLCGLRPRPGVYRLFTSREIQASDASEELLSDGDALLADDAEEHVVLVGTSFSWREDIDANFAGFLQHELSALVDNRATPGGELSISLEAYLRSEDFAEQAPPYLIWELSSYYDMREQQVFRSVIPAVFGACAEADAVLAETATLDGGLATLVSPPAEGLPVDGHYLFLQVDDRSLVDFTLEIEDASGFVDVVPIHRSTRILNDGRFFLELLDLGAPVTEIRLRYLEEHRGTVSTRVCRAPADIAEG